MKCQFQFIQGFLSGCRIGLRLLFGRRHFAALNPGENARPFFVIIGIGKIRGKQINSKITFSGQVGVAVDAMGFDELDRNRGGMDRACEDGTEENEGNEDSMDTKAYYVT